MVGRDTVLQQLNAWNIEYEIEDHPAVYTIEDMEVLGITLRGEIPKNLFLRDASGKRHFLLTLQKDKTADLKAIREKLGTSALSFASEERLMRCLKLTKGAVSPLGILNDTEGRVEFVLDKDLKDRERLGIHPNDNTATLWLSFESLKEVMKKAGCTVRFLEF